MSIEDCKYITLPKISDDRGSLSFIENDRHIPFEIKRIYYLYDIPDSSVRGEHGHKKLEQLIIPLSGSFSIELDDGYERKVLSMDQPNKALYVCPMTWRILENFSSTAVCMVLASDCYDESDYHRDYNEFVKDVKK